MSSAERQQVLGALERLQVKLVQREEWTHSDTMGNLRDTLQSPLFNHILTLQHSIKQLRNQVRNASARTGSSGTGSESADQVHKPGGNQLTPTQHQSDRYSTDVQSHCIIAAHFHGNRRVLCCL